MSSIIGNLLRRLGVGTSKEPGLFDRNFVPADHALRSTLDDRYVAMRLAMASGQREAIAALLAPHFVSIDVRGKESTADQMVDSVLRLNIDRSKLTAITTLVHIEESDGVARVLQHYAMTAVAGVGPAMTKKLQTLSSDTWRDSDGVWLLAKTQTLEVEFISGIGSRHYLKAREVA